VLIYKSQKIEILLDGGCYETRDISGPPTSNSLKLAHYVGTSCTSEIRGTKNVHAPWVSLGPYFVTFSLYPIPPVSRVSSCPTPSPGALWKFWRLVFLELQSLSGLNYFATSGYSENFSSKLHFAKNVFF
jgi:hypothetical protein